jgi:hypothetical protein
MTILESYKALQKGKMNKAQFMERVRKDRALSSFVTNVLSFDDTVKILKNKGIISENTEEIGEYYNYSSDYRKNPEFKAACEEAERISAEEGVVQHVNMKGTGFEVSDWYDSDTTVCSFERGMQLEESSAVEQKEVNQLKPGDVLASGIEIESQPWIGARTPSGKMHVNVRRGDNVWTATWGKYTKVGVRSNTQQQAVSPIPNQKLEESVEELLPNVGLGEVHKGVEYELGILDKPVPNWGEEGFISEKDYQKAIKKVLMNLEIDPSYYTKLIATGKKPKKTDSEDTDPIEFSKKEAYFKNKKTAPSGYLKKEFKSALNENMSVKQPLSSLNFTDIESIGTIKATNMSFPGSYTMISTEPEFERWKSGILRKSPQATFTLIKSPGSKAVIKVGNTSDTERLAKWGSDIASDAAKIPSGQRDSLDETNKNIKEMEQTRNSVKQIVDYLKDNPGATEKEIQWDIWGYKRNNMYAEPNKKYAEMLRRALDKGIVARARVKTPGGAPRYFYYLPNSETIDTSKPAAEKPLSEKAQFVKEFKDKVTTKLKERLNKEAVKYTIGADGSDTQYRRTVDPELEKKLKTAGVTFTKKNVS